MTQKDSGATASRSHHWKKNPNIISSHAGTVDDDEWDNGPGKGSGSLSFSEILTTANNKIGKGFTI